MIRIHDIKFIVKNCVPQKIIITHWKVMKYSISTAVICLSVAFAGNLVSLSTQAKNTIASDKFRQLEEVLPTPNVYRTASGAPGHKYWQQQVDYDIEIKLDDKTQKLTGSETLSYQNNSPDTLRYLWLQLDQNKLKRGSDAKLSKSTAPLKKVTYRGLRDMIESPKFHGGYEITNVTASNGLLRHNGLAKQAVYWKRRIYLRIW